MTKSKWFEVEQTKRSKVKNRSNERIILIEEKNTDAMNLNINPSKNEFREKNVTQKSTERVKQKFEKKRKFEKLKAIETSSEKLNFQTLK